MTEGEDERNNVLAVLQPLVTPGYIKAKATNILSEDKRLASVQDLELKPPEKAGGAERTRQGCPWGQAGPGFPERKMLKEMLTFCLLSPIYVLKSKLFIFLYQVTWSSAVYKGFPCGFSGKEPPCQCKRHERCSIPG